MADNYLLEALPGMTLAQIDGLDVHRLARALQVRRIRDVEARRKLNVEGKLKADALTPDEWRMIRDHDALLCKMGLMDG
jgi:uncharacterized membrane protein